MSFLDLLAPLRPLTLILIGFSGFFAGYLVVSLTPTARLSGLMAWMFLLFIGTTYYAPLTIARAIDNVPNWQLTIGVWLVWVLFITAITCGIEVKRYKRNK